MRRSASIRFRLLLLASLLVAVVGLAVVGQERGAWGRLAGTVSAGHGAQAPEGGAWIEPGDFALAALPRGLDPRWGEVVERALAAHPPFHSDDPQGPVALAQALAALPCVASVDEVRVGWSHDGAATGSVAGSPDSPGAPAAPARPTLFLALRFQEPVACISTAAGFLTVAADGSVLNGLWPAPPRLGSAPRPEDPVEEGDSGCWLPLIQDDPEGPLFTLARPGDWLTDPEHADALDVAVSLRAHLDGTRADRLGRVVIDATRARAASPEEPGIRLLLEDGRLVLFGRAPSRDLPGELPVELKWHGLARALDLSPGVADWDLVDLRWDVPELRLRGGDHRLAFGPPEGSDTLVPAAPRPQARSASGLDQHGTARGPAPPEPHATGRAPRGNRVR